MHEYAVMRCAPASTIRLARDLFNDYGLPVWTPRFTRKIRLPRGRPRRLVEYAMMPSFLFVQRPHEGAVLALSDRRALGTEIRMMFVNSMPVRVKLDELTRISEPTAEPTTVENQPPFYLGEQIIVASGPFEGLAGTVVEIADDDYICVHSKKISGLLKLPGWMLLRSGIYEESTPTI